MTVTNYSDEKGAFACVQKKTVEGIQLGLNSGSLTTLAIWLFKERKRP